MLGDLWVINTDGSGERKVEGEVQQPKSPIWSSDGKTITLNIQRGSSLRPRQLRSRGTSPCHPRPMGIVKDGDKGAASG